MYFRSEDKKPSITELPLPPGFDSTNLDTIFPNKSPKHSVPGSTVKPAGRQRITKRPKYVVGYLTLHV